MLKTLQLLIISFIPFYLSASIDSAKIKKMTEQALELEDNYPDSAYQIADRLYSLSKAANYQQGMSYGLMRMGYIKNRKGENDTALILTKNALALRKLMNDWKGAIYANFNLAYIYQDLGQLDSAYAAMYEALKQNEIVNDTGLKAKIWIELGEMNLVFGKVDEARTYFQRAIAVAKDRADSETLMQAYSGMASYYSTKNLHLKALEMELKINELLATENNLMALFSNLNNLSIIYIELQDYQRALNFARQAAIIEKELDLPLEKSLLYYNMATALKASDSLVKASNYLKESIQIAQAYADKDRLAKAYRLLGEIYEGLADFNAAYLALRKSEELNRELLNEEKINSITEMQTKYETEKKEQQIELLDEQNKTKEAERKVMFYIAAVLALMFLLLGVFYIQRSRIAKKNELIAAQKLEAVLDDQEIKTYNAMLEGQEEERMRIATDLHDRLGSMLSTVKLLFSALDDKIDQQQLENQKQFSKATELLDDACVEVRRISHNLGTGMVANFGLFRSLEELCESINDSKKVNCNVSIFGIEEKELKLNMEVGIYRMVQEAVNNAIKHAKATKIQLQLNRVEEMVNIMIEDDGVGFDTKIALAKDGMGLKNLEKRAQKLNGSVHFDSKPGKGTTIIIDLPLNSTA